MESFIMIGNRTSISWRTWPGSTITLCLVLSLAAACGPRPRGGRFNLVAVETTAKASAEPGGKLKLAFGSDLEVTIAAVPGVLDSQRECGWHGCIVLAEGSEGWKLKMTVTVPGHGKISVSGGSGMVNLRDAIRFDCFYLNDRYLEDNWFKVIGVLDGDTVVWPAGDIRLIFERDSAAREN